MGPGDLSRGGTVTEVDFKNKQRKLSFRAKVRSKGRRLLILSLNRVRPLKLLFLSLLSSFLLWSGQSSDDSFISVLMTGLAIFTILLALSSIVKKEIENILLYKDDIDE